MQEELDVMHGVFVDYFVVRPVELITGSKVNNLRLVN